jgi:hypothetical protein
VLRAGGPGNDLRQGEDVVLVDVAVAVEVGVHADARAVAGDDGLLKLWDPANPLPLVTLSPGRGECASVAFAPDGHAVYGMFRERVMLGWDIMHFNVHIAGNAEYQLERVRPDLPEDAEVDRIVAWARQIRMQVPH